MAVMFVLWESHLMNMKIDKKHRGMISKRLYQSLDESPKAFLTRACNIPYHIGDYVVELKHIPKFVAFGHCQLSRSYQSMRKVG